MIGSYWITPKRWVLRSLLTPLRCRGSRGAVPELMPWFYPLTPHPKVIIGYKVMFKVFAG